MNDRLLKKLILKEIYSVLKEQEDFEDTSEESVDDEDEGPLGIEYDGEVYSPKKFVESQDLIIRDPDGSLASIYKSAGGDPLVKSAKTNSGGRITFYFQRHPYTDGGMRYAGFDEVLIAADSEEELEELVREAEQSR